MVKQKINPMNWIYPKIVINPEDLIMVPEKPTSKSTTTKSISTTSKSNSTVVPKEKKPIVPTTERTRKIKSL